MQRKIKVAAVSYLNTKPLLYGIEHAALRKEIDLTIEYPSIIARQLQENIIDVGLVPVAAIPNIPNAKIISNYGIGAKGKVASVSLFSHVPIEEMEQVYLDYQSRTSIKLAETLLKYYWKKKVVYLPASENYIELIQGKTAGVIIGDRALIQHKNFPFVYDLSEYWEQFTGLHFIFAAWVSNKKLPEDFILRFNEANAEGLNHIDKIIAENPFPDYDLNIYFNEKIQFKFNEKMKEGLQLFLNFLQQQIEI